MGKELKKILYIGEFPPPFGGVSTKNQLIKDYIYPNYDAIWINMYDYKKNPLKLVQFLKYLFQAKKNKWNIYIGSGSNVRLQWILVLIKLLGQNQMLKRASIYVMGSTLESYCELHKICLNLLKQTKRLYVELQTMINGLNRLGLHNTFLLPNCRDGSSSLPPHKLNPMSGIKLLFFSMINREKGVPYLFNMAQILKENQINFSLHFYGELAENYQEEFFNSLKKFPECKYYGVFDSIHNNLYQKLHEYDLLLLPTKWEGESCVGVLIEAKMAGVPCIVSNHHYNGEIVINGKEGFVIDGDLGKGFADTVIHISYDETIYDTIAQGAYESRKRYDIFHYAEQVRQHNEEFE